MNPKDTTAEQCQTQDKSMPQCCYCYKECYVCRMLFSGMYLSYHNYIVCIIVIKTQGSDCLVR